MAIEPGIYNFTLQRRSDHTIPLVFKDSNNAAINLTGFTVAAQVGKKLAPQNLLTLLLLIQIDLLDL